MSPSRASSSQDSSLEVIFSTFQRREPFSPTLFTGFSSLRVLTYTASISMVVHMLSQFETVECVFGYEGIISHFREILGSQRYICESVASAIQGLEDQRKQKIMDFIHEGKASFYVVKGAISHSKLYLLESPTRRLVLTGSANWSWRAFSGKQYEELQAYENDERAWAYFEQRYQQIRQRATNHIASSLLTKQAILTEDLPVIQAAQQSQEPVTVYLHSPTASLSLPRIFNTVEHYSDTYKTSLPQLPQARQGQLQITSELAGKVIHLVKNQKRQGLKEEEPSWLSLNLATKTMILTGKEFALTAEWSAVQSDIACLTEYFENFRQGFVGNVAQHQRDYFLFLCWFYCSPFVCNLRNEANVQQSFVYDFPQFAVLYGKSNCGKSELVKTLMHSMFGYHTWVDKSLFTRRNLDYLRQIRRRFPVAFDDIDKEHFLRHATDLIKDDNFMLDEYPTFTLSMNAEDHSFSSEVYKRCLMVYTRASLPGSDRAAARALHKSIVDIKRRLSTALYHEYLKRMIDHFTAHPLPLDILQCSSLVITDLFAQTTSSPLPHWCRPLTIDDYQGRAYDKVRTELRQLYMGNPAIWKIGHYEIVLLVPGLSKELHRTIPDWILKEGSKAGTIIMDRAQLENFLQMSFRRSWFSRFWTLKDM